LDKRLKEAVRNLLNAKRGEVEDLVLFGSFAENKIGVSSDVDILIIIKNSEKRFIDRGEDFKDYFSNIGLNVDLFIYTRKEVEKGIPFVEKAISKGIHLL
jgi:predicted nucleotidyltransferase